MSRLGRQSVVFFALTTTCCGFVTGLTQFFDWIFARGLRYSSQLSSSNNQNLTAWLEGFRHLAGISDWVVRLVSSHRATHRLSAPFAPEPIFSNHPQPFRIPHQQP